VAQRLRQQAAELAASAQAVASGDLTVRAEVSDDELGRAAGAFNQMTERLAEADRRQRRFLADVAHELRTPVTAIDGFATALVDGAAASPEARAEAVAFIREEAVRLRELIGDLRELTRLDLDPAPDLSSFDLVELARDSVARFSQAAMDAGIELGAPDGTAVAITADKADVETILANLIQNALTATPAGGHVQVEVAREATSVVLRVSDTGVGIAPEHVPRIFDRLYRIDSARARDRGGSGLGLAIVKRLAESLGGSVSVDSSPGTGSTFTVRWPAEPPTHAPAGVSAGRGVTHP
jgi:signal transduction histidine kinase